MEPITSNKDKARIEELKIRLEEAEQLIDAIKAGEVDAFALNRNNQPEIFTLQTGDYAYRVLVENFSEGALNLSEDGLIVYSNTAFHEMLKLSYDKVISHNIFDFIAESSVSVFKDIFKKSLAGQGKGEINLIAGEISVPVYISLTSLYPTLPTVGMIITNLSEKKKHEKSLELQNKLIQQSNIELQKMNKELESFTYIASHDLQEPLRKIQAFADIIHEKEKDNLSEAGKDYFVRMQGAAVRMRTLITDLLAFSRISTAERKMEEANLAEIVNEVKEEFKDSIKEKNATVSVGRLPNATVIPFQFRQLIYNLMGNSIKFSRPDIPLKIDIKGKIEKGTDLPLKGKGDLCHLSFSDNGIGFDQAYNEQIFGLFQKLHGRAEYDGTGIGLAIVKKIMEQHNGSITATSKLGEGARFDIYIPA